MRLHLRKVILFGCCFTFMSMLISVEIMKKRNRRVWAKHLREEGGVFNTNLTDKDSIAKGINRTEIRVPCVKQLIGKLKIDQSQSESKYWNLSGVANVDTAQDKKFLGIYGNTTMTKLLLGSIHLPKRDYCVYQRAALIIPFRDREQHLKILLGHLLPILERQKISYIVFVAEQFGTETFNKGRLMNTAFEFAATYGRAIGEPFQCFIYHDVDMLAEYDTTSYRCTPGPTINHFVTSINKYQYRKLCCYVTVGGAVAFKEKEFRMVNGYPNSYWGWGGEDDDMDLRLSHHNITITRPRPPLGRYSMIKHRRDQKNPINSMRWYNLKKATTRFETDGLSNLRTKILQIHRYPLFIKLLIDVNPPR